MDKSVSRRPTPGYIFIQTDGYPSWVRKVRQVGVGQARVGPVGFLESRTATALATSAISTQLSPLPLPLRLLLHHTAQVKSIVDKRGHLPIMTTHRCAELADVSHRIGW
jgi:hypothetical protein